MFYCARFLSSNAQPYSLVRASDLIPPDSYFATFFSECSSPVSCTLTRYSIRYASLCNLHSLFSVVSSDLRDSLGLLSSLLFSFDLTYGVPLSFLACDSCALFCVRVGCGDPIVCARELRCPISFLPWNDMILRLHLELRLLSTETFFTEIYSGEPCFSSAQCFCASVRFSISRPKIAVTPAIVFATE